MMETIKEESKEVSDEMTSSSITSPRPPSASPVPHENSQNGPSSDSNTPVMLTTMQPVPLTAPGMDIPPYDDNNREFIYQVDGKNVEFVRQDDLPPGTVSVVVQPPGGGSYLPGYQPTVLVLSELVDDMGVFRASSSAGKTTNGLTGSDLAPPPGDLQALFLHGQIKREPEDLSHHRKSPSDLAKGRQKVVLVTQGGEVVDVVNNNNSIKEGLSSSPHGARSLNGTPPGLDQSELLASDGLGKSAMSYSTQIFSPMTTTAHSGHSGTPSPIPYSEHAGYSAQGGLSTAGYITTSASALRGSAASAFTVSDPYYREYFAGEQSYVRQQVPVYADTPDAGGGTLSSGSSAFVDRYGRSSSVYHSKGVIAAAGLTVDLPSPDSGIGADAVTPRDQTQIQQSFDYTDLCPTGILSDQRLTGVQQSSPGQGQSRSRPWHDFGRQSDADKIQIPKVYSSYGFKYHLEAPISTSQRREDDRITYINKGQFYGITLDYIPDPDKTLKSQTVKSVVMLMFREEKSPEDEIKAWQFWHGRQHSVKQRILDADTKNSVGLVGCIEEVAHNAIAVYWNPLESSAKINVAVQCLSTDFSSQKGVKGLPLHLQIDTYEDPRDGPVSHRGYCQIKVFCDKGAERKTRDEERRAAKRKMTATGRKKIDELYHPACERSEFYGMSDLTKPPVLFSPAEDSLDKAGMDLQNFYGHETEGMQNGESLGKHSPYLLHSKPATTPTLKFHNHFPPEPIDKKDGILDSGLTTDGTVFSPPIKRPKMISAPPQNERVMLYVRQEGDEVYTPLHVVPPTTQGLINAIENKYKIYASNISNIYRKNRKGITVKIDDDMLKYYCNEDLFLMDIRQDREDSELIEITLIELMDR